MGGSRGKKRNARGRWCRKTHTAGVITEFNISTEANGITAGLAGNVWYMGDHNLGRITTTGVVTTFGLSPYMAAHALAVGPDGNLCFQGKSTLARALEK